MPTPDEARCALALGADLPTARLRQMRDGHNPDDAQHGRARTQRITRLQQQVVDAAVLAVELETYRQAAWRIDTVKPVVRRLVDREIRRMIDRATAHRDQLDQELRALQ